VIWIFAAGVLVGLPAGAVAGWVWRRETDIYRRMGTLDFSRKKVGE
jgi:hypothetical protein